MAVIVHLPEPLLVCCWFVLGHLQVVVVVLVLLLIVVLDRRHRFPMLGGVLVVGSWFGHPFAPEVHLGGNADTGAKCPGTCSVEVHSIV